MMEPLTDVRDISRIGYGFMASKALFLALDFDIFTRLAEAPRDVAALAAATGVRPNQMATLMTALASLGLIERRDGAFVNAPASAAYLVRGAPAYYGDYFRYQIDKQIYPSLARLGAAFRGERIDFVQNLTSGPDEAALFSHAQHVGSLGPANILAKQVDLAGCGRLLDVAGGSGAFSITLCQRHPRLEATILDFPAVVEIARDYVARAGLTGRIGFVAGDALTTPWPAGQDAVLMSYLLSAVGAEVIPTLLARAFAALKPGGRLIVHDFMADDDGNGPTTAALWLLANALRLDAVGLTPGLLAAALRQAGLAAGETRDLIPTITRVVVARKRAA
jgi:SAM-dependent methyltransferase